MCAAPVKPPKHQPRGRLSQVLLLPARRPGPASGDEADSLCNRQAGGCVECPGV